MSPRRKPWIFAVLIALGAGSGAAWLALERRSARFAERPPEPSSDSLTLTASSAAAKSPATPGVATPGAVASSGRDDDEPAGDGALPDLSDARHVTPSELRRYARAVLRTLPRVPDLQKLEEGEVHGLPEPLMEAGQHLAKLAQLIHDNPALADEGMAFYQDCAALEELSVSVRALCLASLWKVQKQTGVTAARGSAENYPAPVVEIASQLD